MHHINDDGNAKPCHASIPERCKFYNGPDDSRHYENEADAQRASEKILADKHGKLATSRRYSFLKQFKEKEREFNEQFEGVPTRFFSKSLEVKGLADVSMLQNDSELERAVLRAALYKREIVKNFATSVSSPKDSEIDEQTVMEVAAQAGLSDVEEVHDASVLTNFKTDRLWIGKTADGKPIVITSASIASKNFNYYRFRYGGGPTALQGQKFTRVDLRTLVGSMRVEKLTGVSVAKIALDDINTNEKTKDLSLNDRRTLEGAQLYIAQSRLQDAQLQGANFKAQQRRFNDQQKTAATAWMDKKNQDEKHIQMANNSPLKQHFSKIEIDNDVDDESFRDFEAAYLDVKDKLPKFPGDRAPELRVRYLGRHKATGVYFPHSNTIAVDVHTSSAFIHEYGHFMDIAVKNNASLSNEFREIMSDYSSSLKVPDNMSAQKLEYYAAPTEALARGFEIYSHEKLGIDNRLLDSAKFDNFDYQPFMQDKALKERTFAFFDKVFSDN